MTIHEYGKNNAKTVMLDMPVWQRCIQKNGRTYYDFGKVRNYNRVQVVEAE